MIGSLPVVRSILVRRINFRALGGQQYCRRNLRPMKPHIITVVVEKWRRYHGRLGAGPDKGDNWSHRMLFEVVLFGFRPAKPKGFVRSPGISFQSLLFHRKFNELREKRWDRTTTVLPGTRGPDPEEFAGGDGGGAAGLGSANSGGEGGRHGK
jgi:hypothetical protein